MAMKIRSGFITIYFLLASVLTIFDASLFSSEPLPMINSLAAYTLSWAGFITRAREIIEKGGIPEQGTYHDGSRTSLQQVKVLEKRIGLTALPDKKYLILKKKFANNIELRFCDFDRSFIANNIKIETIGYFLSPSIALGIYAISLNHNNLYSFTEIQEKILVPCPHLKKLSLNNNKFDGVVALSHETLEYFWVAHNNFSSIGTIYLPRALCVDLSFNQLLYRRDTPEVVVGRYCTVFDVTNNPGLRIESVDMHPDA